MTRILLLGGTTEASQLAGALAAAGIPALFSYAGRTEAPRAQPLPLRVGGFGGAEGLADFLRAGGYTHLIDATHPFAAAMSRNAVAAAEASGIPILAFERPGWTERPGDDWTRVANMDAALAALPETPVRVFLAIGRQNIATFAPKPQHHYLLRLVDPPTAPLPLPDTHVILDRGPFTEAGDLALLKTHAITHLVAKNAGGSGAEAKLTAARALKLPVILIDRPALPPRPIAATVAEVMDWLAHPATDRGV